MFIFVSTCITSRVSLKCFTLNWMTTIYLGSYGSSLLWRWVCVPDYFGTVELGYGHRRALIINLCEFRNTKNYIQRNILMAQFTEILIETQSHRISAIHLFPRIITRARGYTIYIQWCLIRKHQKTKAMLHIQYKKGWKL